MLGNIFKTQRENIGWSQQEFAKKAKISVFTIYKAEKGEKPTTKTLKKILSTLCLTIDDVLSDPNLTDQERLYLENKKYERFYGGKD